MNLILASKEIIELRCWVFRLHKGPFYVRIQGYRDVADKNKQSNPRCWLTSPISYCENARILVTISGSRYVLKGSIDVDAATIHQYPSFLIDVFKDGFPDNWERLLRALHLMMNMDDKMCNPFINPTLWRITNVPISDFTPSISQRRKSKNTKANDSEVFFFSNSSNDISFNSCRDIVPVQPLHGSLSVSKRGRIIKPRLQTWEGERIVYDIYGNVVSAHSVITREANKPEYSSKLAAICDGLGVSRLESSKQSHRLSIVSLETPKSRKSAKRRSCGVNRKLVDYSSSEDSFLEAVDQISLPSSPDQSAEILTPIPLKRAHAQRIIRSAKKPIKLELNDNLENIENITPKKLSKTKKVPENQKCPKILKPQKVKVPRNAILLPEVKKEREIASKLSETPKIKRWTADETKRLKIALKAAVNPQTNEDWELIARSVSNGMRNGVECHEKAIKLRWKPDLNTSANISSPSTSNRRSLRNIQKKMRRNNDSFDFFSHTPIEKRCNVSLMDLDPNDSLLSVLKTPTEDPKFMRKPFIMQQVLNETRRSQNSENCDETLY